MILPLDQQSRFTPSFLSRLYKWPAVSLRTSLFTYPHQLLSKQRHNFPQSAFLFLCFQQFCTLLLLPHDWDFCRFQTVVKHIEGNVWNVKVCLHAKRWRHTWTMRTHTHTHTRICSRKAASVQPIRQGFCGLMQPFYIWQSSAEREMETGHILEKQARHTLDIQTHTFSSLTCWPSLFMSGWPIKQPSCELEENSSTVKHLEDAAALHALAALTTWPCVLRKSTRHSNSTVRSCCPSCFEGSPN